jgi:tetratricopeptide (TPR) repeat protein
VLHKTRLRRIYGFPQVSRIDFGHIAYIQALAQFFMESIEQQLNQVDWQNLESISRFYEANQLYFDNYQIIEDEERISDFIDIKLHYVNALYKKAHYDKVMKTLGQVEDLLFKLGKNHWNYIKSERYVRFMKGRVYGDRKNYAKSFSIFKELVKEDSEHHYYWVWYYHTKLGLYNWIFNTASTGGLILIFFDLVFSLDKFFGMDVGIIGILLTILSYLIQTLLTKYYKQKKPPLTMYK